jgi:transcriptional regulator GlxA family with amidase domain
MAAPATIHRQGFHTVAALLTDVISGFELSVASEVFGLRRPELADPWYDYLVVAVDDDPPIEAAGGLRLDTPYRVRDLVRADTIVVPAWSPDWTPSPELLDAVCAAHERGARLLSFCSGAFLYAEAGLLDGRSATTHWMFADLLAERFPAVQVDKSVLYVDEGQILTSAGTAAAIDLCLHVVRQDLGAEVANGVARRMVVPPQRDGGQAQFVEAPVPACAGADPLVATLDWAVAHLDQPHTVETLARRAMMSPRTFARRFVAATGTTPLQWLLRQRVLFAQRMLETSDEPVELIAHRCGFGSAAVLRTHFQRHVGTSPMAYRRTFRGPEELSA